MMRSILVSILATLFVLANGVALAQSRSGTDWGFDHMMNWGGGWGGMILGPILMIVTLVLVFVVVVAVLRWLGIVETGGKQPQREETAIEILEKRFARGEIDETEFKSRKSLLGH